MAEFDQQTLVEMLGGTGSAPRAAVDAVQYHGLASLLNGTAQTLSGIAARSGLPLSDVEDGVRALVEVGRIDLDGDRVIGVGGLTLTSTVHSLSLPDAELHTWCALDAVGIPAALGLTATVQTRCPQCDGRITVDVDEGSATAAGSVTLFCPTAPCDNVRADFCSAANLFCSPTHVTRWRQDHPSALGEDLDLAAATRLGHAMWGHYQHGPSSTG
jgi:alkylmercury lyase